MKNTLFLIIVVFLFSCGESTKNEESNESSLSLNDQLVGTWTNISLNVIIRLDSADSIVNVPEGKWEEVLGIKPIITDINADGTFVSNYFTLEDELLMTSNGTWTLEGDTLTMVQNDVATHYHFSVDEGIGTFKGYLDWDQDGEADDMYSGKQSKKESNK